MSNVSQVPALVKALRNAFAKDGQHYCQCGQYCPLADACIPRTDPINEPYYTIERHQSAVGYRWTAFLYDPEKGYKFRKSNQSYGSPCQAAHNAARQALVEKRALRIDRAVGVTNFDLLALEVKVATELANAGDMRLVGWASEAPAALVWTVPAEVTAEALFGGAQ